MAVGACHQGCLVPHRQRTPDSSGGPCPAQARNAAQSCRVLLPCSCARSRRHSADPALEHFTSAVSFERCPFSNPFLLTALARHVGSPSADIVTACTSGQQLGEDMH